MRKLPNGWVECSLDKVIYYQKGKKPSILTNFKEQDLVPYLDIEAFVNNNIRQYADKTSSKLITKNDVLVVWDGARSGLTELAKEGAIGSTIMALTPIKIEQKYLFRFIQSKYTYINTKTKGTGIPHVDPNIFWNINFPLPSLNEQRRIVAKLEKLLSKVDACKERLEKIPTILKHFRQSVLAAACSGRLTADWREKNPDLIWQKTILMNVLKNKPRNGYSPKSVNYETPVKSLTLTATTSGIFKRYFKYIDEEIATNSHLWLHTGDILIQRSNTIEYVGVSAIYDALPKEFIYPDLMMKLQIKENEAEVKYIYYALSNLSTRNYYRQNATGTSGNMPKINQPVVMNTPLELPSLPEQQEIVLRVEALFKKADAIEQRYQKAKSYIDKITPSILAKAFRGELVPQDPNDEPASVLLERIRQEKAQNEKNTKTKPKKTSAKKTPKQVRDPNTRQQSLF